MKRALQANSRLYASGLIQSELFHVVERVEYELFTKFNQVSSVKEFRHKFPIERARVVQECQTAWAVVQNIAEVITLAVGPGLTAKVDARLPYCAMDGYDLMTVEAMIEQGIPQVLTDDGDFCTVPEITVFTANPKVISAASSQGRLVTR